MTGRTEERVRLQAGDFDISRELERVKAVSKTIGGVAVFVGVVRDFSRDQEVEKLHFEYYPGMAEEKLEGLRQEAMETFGLTELFLVHRYGELLPGENIVLIIAAAEHRQEAFTAASWCMAELKERVPIWKKEYTASGEVWVEGGQGK